MFELSDPGRGLLEQIKVLRFRLNFGREYKSMFSLGTFNHKRMREFNTGSVLNLLRRYGPMSRIDIAKKLGLDRTTITHIVRDLFAAELIQTSGLASSEGGRPKEILRLKANGRLALGLNIEPHRITGVLVNLEGKIKLHEEFSVTPEDSKDVLLKKTKTFADKVLFSSISSRLLGVGLAYHGIVNKKTGEVLHAAYFPSWEKVNVYDFLNTIFDIPFEIENNTRTKAVAEYWFGAGRGIPNFVLLDIGLGIGCAIVAEGKLQCGVSDSAGEIGHNSVASRGKLCKCGQRGCLEAVASIPAIEEIFNEMSGSSDKASFEKICQLVSMGDGTAIKVVREASRHIGKAASSLINILNPAYLVICGELLQAGNILQRTIKTEIRKNTVSTSFQVLQIVQGQIGQNSAAVGAAALLLRKMFETDQ